MASRGAYERRGNVTSQTVREKAGANKPITRREMRAAYQAWQMDKAKGNTRVYSAHLQHLRIERRKKYKDGDNLKAK